MNLIELFDTLLIPNEYCKVFNATLIPEYPEFRIAVDSEGNAVLLLSVSNRLRDSSLKNFRLKYLQLEKNVECKILIEGFVALQSFTVITFKSNDRNLQEYFLRISETLVKTIGREPTHQQLISSLKKLIEVFKALTDMPVNTINGLWAELFLIDNAKNSKELLNYWHNIPEEKFDFNAGLERIEVKSTSTFERKHTFSSQQLNPPKDTQVLIASIFMKQSSSGINIRQLIDRISQKLGNDYILIDKLNSNVCKILGSALEHSLGIMFDYEIAKHSLKFYRHQDISKIEEINIPNNVSDVHYKSDLTNAKEFDFSNLVANTLLYSKLY